MHYEVRVLGIIGLQVHGIVVLAIHARMHHKNAGFNIGAFTWLKDHRTDGQFGRSAPLQDFDIRFVLETKNASPAVGDLDLEGLVVAKGHIAVVDLLRVCGDLGRAVSTATSTPGTGPVSQKERGNDQQDPAKYKKRPWKVLPLTLPSLLSTHSFSYLRAIRFLLAPIGKHVYDQVRLL
jgi:hypothetical protein